MAVPDMEELVGGEPRRLRARILYALARFQEDRFGAAMEGVLVLFFAWLIPVVAAPGAAGVAFLAAFFALFAQFEMGARVAATPGDAVHLAYRSSRAGRGKTPSLLVWREHMAAMRRLGDELAHGYAKEALLMAVPKKVWLKPDRPQSFDDVADAVEMGLALAAGSLPAERRGEAFLDYARSLEAVFVAGPVTADSWRAFLVSRYMALPRRGRALSKAHSPKPFLDRVEDQLRRRKTVIEVVLAILGIAAGLVLYVVR